MDGEVAQLASESVVCDAELRVRAIPAVPRVEPGCDLAQLLCAALRASEGELRECDVIVVTSKVVAKAEGRYVDLSTVTPSEQAFALAAQTGKDPRAVELVLWDAERVSRVAANVLIVRHHGGHVSANAGIDLSNARPPAADGGSGPWALRLPADPNASAAALRAAFEQAFGVRLGVIISDSFGRPFRNGSVGVAIGVAGLPALYDQRGRADLDGRALEHTVTATADQLAAAADLVCGQADEARPLALVRGLTFPASVSDARALCRPADQDLYL